MYEYYHIQRQATSKEALLLANQPQMNENIALVKMQPQRQEKVWQPLRMERIKDWCKQHFHAVHMFSEIAPAHVTGMTDGNTA